MNARHCFIIMLLSLCLSCWAKGAETAYFKLNEAGYFSNQGSEVMVFSDRYPEGHQGGITLVQQALRMAACGDIRMEATPGQWQGLPKLRRLECDTLGNEIRVHLSYPDSANHQTGFNPMLYADFQFDYVLTVRGIDGGVEILVDIDRPVPSRFAGKIGFNLELQPSTLLGQHWLMDRQSGMFAHQAMGPTLRQESNTRHLGDYFRNDPEARWPRYQARLDYLLPDSISYNPMRADDIISAPLAVGHQFVLDPQSSRRVVIESRLGDLKLYDGRMNHQNGWFVLRTEFEEGAQGRVAHWVVRPHVDAAWRYSPVVQTSQIGYHPQQEKMAVIELDPRTGAPGEEPYHKVALYRITADGAQLVGERPAERCPGFARYQYLRCDFSDVCDEGLYQVGYGSSLSPVFRIAEDVWQQGIWQSEIEYFLPIQMCHMRVSEKYRVWHDLCHTDDGVMAPVGFNHIDGYTQADRTFCDFEPGDRVPGLTVGGWHDAGDWDLRVESQAIQSYLLALQVENLQAYWDETTIDFASHQVEIHQPDGINDYLQQIENGALTLVAGWRALGRLYRGIVCPTVRQYVYLGDAAGHTDRQMGTADDRWVFTEDNPMRELQTAAQLAAVARVLRTHNDTLSAACLQIAQKLFDTTETPAAMSRWVISARLHCAVELYLTTHETRYRDFVIDHQKEVIDHIDQTGWFIGRFDRQVDNRRFSKAIRNALAVVAGRYAEYAGQTPYGVPSDHGNRSSGSWEPQHEGFVYCMLYESYPDLFPVDYISRCVQFFLGMHPGSNRNSLVAGVGSETVKTLYGGNRADWSYIPGGVAPGPNLIRPDLPEWLHYPFLWQQGEFCIDGHNTWFHYMALELARIYR